MPTYTTDLTKGMRLEAPVRGTVQAVESISEDDSVFLVKYLTLDGEKVRKATDAEHWTLQPEITFAWEPDELYVLRDGDTWIHVEFPAENEQEAGDWVAKHYPAATFQVGGIW